MVTKKLFMPLCTLAACMAMGACQRESAGTWESVSGTTTVPLLIEAEGDRVRTSLEDDGKVLWLPGDAVSVFDGSANNRFSNTLEIPSQSAVFSGSIAESTTTIYAIYPYSTGNRFSAGTITASLPEEQTGITGGIADGLNPSVSKASINEGGIVRTTFLNICSIIRFTISQNNVYHSVKLRSLTEGVFLCGQYQISFNESTPVLSTNTQSKREITLVPAEGDTFAAGTYCFVCLPCENAGLELEFSDGDKLHILPATSGKTLAANKLTDFGTLDSGWTLDESAYHFVLDEDFGSRSTYLYPIVGKTGTSVRQLVAFDNQFNTRGRSANTVNYYAGMRTDIYGNRFQTGEEAAEGIDNACLYFGNTNNSDVIGAGGNPTTVAGYGKWANAKEQLTFYVNNVYVGSNATKARVFFDYSVAQLLITNFGNEGRNALSRLITVEYTPDGGKTWTDISDAGGNYTFTGNFRYTSKDADLSGLPDGFVTFRIKANYKQSLYIDNLKVAATYATETTANNAPSIVKIYRQTPTTAYLECRAPAGVTMTGDQMNTVVPHIGPANGTLTAASDFTIRNVDVEHQMFEIVVRNLPQNGDDMAAALNYGDYTSGRHWFPQSAFNEIFTARFDRFTAGTNPVESIGNSVNISGSISSYTNPGGPSSGNYNTLYNRERDLRDATLRCEVYNGYNTSGTAPYASATYRGGNNMEASFRSSNNIFSFLNASDITHNGPKSAGDFLRYGCEMDGWRLSLCYELEGCLHMGTGSSKGWDSSSNTAFLMTPIFGSFIPSGTASVTISFDAMPQGPNTHSQIQLVRVQTDGVTENGAVTTILKTFDLDNTDFGRYTRCSYTLTDADARTAFLIGGPSGATTNARYFLDNIVVVRD